ncbi:MAG: hypothetical protein ACYTE8_01425 [Planctomycetota bacterium]|jgi:hypothetical protein
MVKAAKIALFLGLFFLSLVIVADSMTKSIGHDEHMYCTAAALMSKGEVIYRDFSYVAQLPYHPTICAAIYKLFNTTRFLLAARIFSSACDILVVLLIAYIFCGVLKHLRVASKLLGLAAAVLYIFNPAVDYANGFAWNHDMVALCVLASFTIFITTDFKETPKCWRFAFIGGLLTLATWSRMTTALIYIVFLIAILKKSPGTAKQKTQALLPFFAASFVISIWPLIIFFMAPKALILNVLAIPIFNGEWLREVAKIPGPWQVIFYSLTKPAYIILFALIAYFFVTIVSIRKRIQPVDHAGLILSSVIVVIFFIIVFIPPAMFEQYFAMPALFIIISFAYALLYISKLNSAALLKKHLNIAFFVITASLILTIASNLKIINRIPNLFKPQNLPPMQLHNISMDISDKIGEPKLALTLAPLYALEGGCEIYREFSAGPFVYRIADLINEESLQIVTGAGMTELTELTENFHPSAIVLGTEPHGLEQPIYNAAVKPEWKRINYPQGIVVFYKP